MCVCVCACVRACVRVCVCNISWRKLSRIANQKCGLGPTIRKFSTKTFAECCNTTTFTKVFTRKKKFPVIQSPSSPSQFIATVQRVLGGPLTQTHPVIKVPLTLLAYCLKNLMLMYPVTCFMLLSWDQCYAVRHTHTHTRTPMLAFSLIQFMKAVYFYGHVVPIVWLIGYKLVRWLQKRWRREKRE